MKRLALITAAAFAVAATGTASASELKPPGPCAIVSEAFETANVQPGDLPDSPVPLPVGYGDVCAVTG